MTAPVSFQTVSSVFIIICFDSLLVTGGKCTSVSSNKHKVSIIIPPEENNYTENYIMFSYCCAYPPFLFDHKGIIYFRNGKMKTNFSHEGLLMNCSRIAQEFFFEVQFQKNMC